MTVPLRADDRDPVKWQKFFDTAKEKHLIPLIRLATVMVPGGWEKPTLYDAVDFANFLNDLNWPTKNRYIIVYNEPNHATEWGGAVDPADYARILDGTAQIFKQRSDAFFILPAGLDAAAPNAQGYMSLYSFLNFVAQSNPTALARIDGWNSHSYPNPAFSGRPWDTSAHSVVSFRQENQYIAQMTGKKLPVFITETGWSNLALADETVGEYYRIALTNVWSDSQIVAITPFILMAGDGPFKQFSLLNPDGSPKPQYLAIKGINKVAGKPELTNTQLAQVLGTETTGFGQPLPGSPEPFESVWGKDNWQKLFKWLMLE